jgi:hypothetical protein
MTMKKMLAMSTIAAIMKKANCTAGRCKTRCTQPQQPGLQLPPLPESPPFRGSSGSAALCSAEIVLLLLLLLLMRLLRLLMLLPQLLPMSLSLPLPPLLVLGLDSNACCA